MRETPERRCTSPDLKITRYLREMFDSTYPVAHREAAALCAECPALAWCQEEARAFREGPYGLGIHGTWAGKLYARKRDVA